jgi:hypothetical protein
MRLLNIESSPRGSRSASIAVTSAFLEAYRQACPGGVRRQGAVDARGVQMTKV